MSYLTGENDKASQKDEIAGAAPLYGPKPRSDIL